MTKPEVKTGQIWMHSNGNPYEVMFLTNEHADPSRRREYPVTVVYRRADIKDGKIWSKGIKGFTRSRTLVS